MKKNWIFVLLIVLILAASLGWEFIGREKLLTSEVVVAALDIEEGTMITKEMLQKKNVYDFKEGMCTVEDVGKIIGLEAKQTIPKGEEIYMEYLTDSKFVAHGEQGEYYFEVPKSWIETIPNGIKKGDSVTFVSDGVDVVSELVTEINPETGNMIIVTNKIQFMRMADLAIQGKRFVVLSN